MWDWKIQLIHAGCREEIKLNVKISQMRKMGNPVNVRKSLKIVWVSGFFTLRLGTLAALFPRGLELDWVI